MHVCVYSTNILHAHISSTQVVRGQACLPISNWRSIQNKMNLHHTEQNTRVSADSRNSRRIITAIIRTCFIKPSCNFPVRLQTKFVDTPSLVQYTFESTQNMYFEKH